MQNYLIIGVILSPFSLHATNGVPLNSIEDFIRGVDVSPSKASLKESLLKGDSLVASAEAEQDLGIKYGMYREAVNAYESVKNSPEVKDRPQVVDYWKLTGKIVVTSGKALNCQQELGRLNK